MWDEHWEYIGRTNINRSEEPFTTVGSNVNLANRLESVANKDQIIISPSTKIRIEDQFNLKTLLIGSPCHDTFNF
jgi:class 3 adenylate cyclase